MFWAEPAPNAALFIVTVVDETELEPDVEVDTDDTDGAPNRVTLTGWPETVRLTSPPAVVGARMPCVDPAATEMLAMVVVQSRYVTDAAPEADIDPSPPVEFVMVEVDVVVDVDVTALAVLAWLCECRN